MEMESGCLTGGCLNGVHDKLVVHRGSEALRHILIAATVTFALPLRCKIHFSRQELFLEIVPAHQLVKGGWLHLKISRPSDFNIKAGGDMTWDTKSILDSP